MATFAVALALLQEAPEDWVRKLGSEDYVEREKATEALRKLGAGAEEALRKAEASEDPEVRSRAKALLEELRPAPKAKKGPARPFVPGPFGRGFRGGSVSVQTVNGDSTYQITPGDGAPAIKFWKAAAGNVKLEYADEAGATKTVEAADLAAFLKEHGDLAARFGVSEDGIAYGGARVSFRAPRNPFGNGPFRFNFGRKGWPFEGPEEPQREAAPAFEPPSEALREQLGLPEGQGVVVARDEAAPGLRKHDVLLEIDGKPVRGVAEAKRGAAGRSFTVLRKGKRETIEAPPRKDF